MHLWTGDLDFAYGIWLLLLYWETDKVLGFTLGMTISELVISEQLLILVGCFEGFAKHQIEFECIFI